MHTLSVNDVRMHFNSDMSGTVQIELPNDQKFEIPGELIRMYIRKYVIASVRDGYSDVLYRLVTNFGGKDTIDFASVMGRIDDLKPISEHEDKAAVLHGTTELFGQFVHIEFLKVIKHRDRFVTVDPAYQEELDRLESVTSARGPLSTIKVPGFQGDYVAFTYPYTE